MVPTDENRARIDAWVAIAPVSRIVETTKSGGIRTTQALEDGEVRYEETDFGTNEPVWQWGSLDAGCLASEPDAGPSWLCVYSTGSSSGGKCRARCRVNPEGRLHRHNRLPALKKHAVLGNCQWPMPNGGHSANN
jgi:hypothetical protein